MWDCHVARGCAGSVIDVGAATWGSGISGIAGFVSTANSLVGSSSGDLVGTSAKALNNGNYVVGSYNWDFGATADVGAATWASGITGLIGTVTNSNSLIGSTAGDQVGAVITALSNGNYVVSAPQWDCQLSQGCSGAIANVGAVTWGSGTSGITGSVTLSNSLIGSSVDDKVASLIALQNGNYAVGTGNWNCQIALGCLADIADVGAVTWGSGSTGISGQVTKSNSIIGATLEDKLGYSPGMFGTIVLYALSSGDFIIPNTAWGAADESLVLKISGVNGAAGSL